MSSNNQNMHYWGSKCLTSQRPDDGSSHNTADGFNEQPVRAGTQQNAQQWEPNQQAAGWQVAAPQNGQQQAGAAPNNQWQAHAYQNGAQWQAGQQVGAQWQGVPSQPYVQPQQVYRSGKDRIVAGLLAILLGGFGIHKFYLGYNSVGFIMLGVSILGSIFTLGLAGMVMWVIGIVEGIIYLTNDQQSFDHTYVYNMKEWF